MVYLASPYSHPSLDVREYRWWETLRFVKHHMAQGILLFSPIVYGHQFSKHLFFPSDAEAWKEFNTYHMSVCAEVWVLRLPDWEKSYGVNCEVIYARENNIPVTYKDQLE